MINLTNLNSFEQHKPTQVAVIDPDSPFGILTGPDNLYQCPAPQDISNFSQEISLWLSTSVVVFGTIIWQFSNSAGFSSVILSIEPGDSEFNRTVSISVTNELLETLSAQSDPDLYGFEEFFVLKFECSGSVFKAYINNIEVVSLNFTYTMPVVDSGVFLNDVLKLPDGSKIKNGKGNFGWLQAYMDVGKEIVANDGELVAVIETDGGDFIQNTPSLRSTLIKPPPI